jgi:hypothetical protein
MRTCRTLAILALLTAAASPIRAQALTWSHAIGAATTITVGVYLDPRAHAALNQLERHASPYGFNRVPATGQYLLPDYSVFGATCDVQHLHWLGVGNWRGPRAETQTFWWGVGAAGTWTLHRVHAPAPVALSIAGMTSYNVIRARIIPGYHLDALGYAASIGSWGVDGALEADHRVDWTTRAALALLWLHTYQWGTPTVNDPAPCVD